MEVLGINCFPKTQNPPSPLQRLRLDKFLPDLIFVTNITNIISGEKIVMMWRNFSFPCMTIVGKLKISPHVEKFQMSPHEKNKQCVHLMRFYCNLCRFVEPKSRFVEKK